MPKKKAAKKTRKVVRKVAKKVVRKVAKKVVRKVAKKAVRKVAKKAVRKVAKKAVRKVAKKAMKPGRRVAQKTTRKPAKKPVKKVVRTVARKPAPKPVRKVAPQVAKPVAAPKPAARPVETKPGAGAGVPAGPGVVKRPVPERRVLVLGAGLVARPMVQYLLRQPGYRVTVATRTVRKALDIIGGHAHGEPIAYDISDAAGLAPLVGRADLVVSLLPNTHHLPVARACVERRKHLVTTSYVSDAMRALDDPARVAGIALLNEIGLDPGIDHMSAMRVIHKVKRGGGSIAHFHSYCGGLPAPDANTNPLGYKFSWSPRGVLLAGRQAAKYRKDGQLVEIPGPKLFENYWEVKVDDHGTFEAYPNRDSLGYLPIYGIDSAKTILRGTLRNGGWCRFMKKVVDLGLLTDTPRNDLGGMTMVQFTRSLLGHGAGSDIRVALAQKLDLPPDSEVVLKFEWLGLFSAQPVPVTKGGNIDVMTALMHGKMQYAKGERDMILLRHEFVAEYPGGRREDITSTLIDFGVPGGDTAMSRTVALPAAIACKMILEGRIERRGVCIPVEPAIFHPVLDELAALGINCVEKTTVR